MFRRIGPIIFAALLAVPLVAGLARAQSTDFFAVDYFDTTLGEATVRIVNPTFRQPVEDPNGNPSDGLLCAMIYVYDSHEELQECCGCPVTNNGLRRIGVISDLTSNPVSGSRPTTGVIKIVSSSINNAPSNTNTSPDPKKVCNPAKNPNLTPILISWIAQVNASGKIANVTETQFEEAALGDLELQSLVNLCSVVVHQNGTNRGRCACGVGDDSAAIPRSKGRN